MPPSTSRPPRDDEISVMHYFCHHISLCVGCDYRSFTSSGSLRGASLCTRGRSFALDVNRYLYHYHGVAYSTCGLTKYRVPYQVEVPGQFSLVRRLLQAVEYEGLQLQRPNWGREREIVGWEGGTQPAQVTEVREILDKNEHKSRKHSGVVLQGPMTVHIHLGGSGKFVVS